MSKRIRWTDEMVLDEIRRIHSEGEPMNPAYINRNYGGLYRQSFNRFGSWRSAVNIAIDVDYESLLLCTQWTGSKVIDEIKRRYVRGESLTAGVVVNENKKLHDAAGFHLGSWRVAVESAGFSYEKVLAEGNESRSKKCTKYQAEEVLDVIRNRYESGLKVSAYVMRDECPWILKAGRYRFGSWKDAIAAAGIDYKLIREGKDSVNAGLSFEEVVGEILTFAKVSVNDYSHEKWKPDFTISKHHWVDAKLSSWTASIPSTVEKYEPYVKRLSIVYLRGKPHGKEYSNKTEIISVFELLDALPPEDGEVFKEKLDGILDSLNKKAA